MKLISVLVIFCMFAIGEYVTFKCADLQAKEQVVDIYVNSRGICIYEIKFSKIWNEYWNTNNYDNKTGIYEEDYLMKWNDEWDEKEHNTINFDTEYLD